MDASDFSELVQEAEKLTADIEEVSELPTIDRSLHQVLQDSQELFSRVARSGSQDVQANLLLGSQGIDLPRIAQKLESISTKHTFEPIKRTINTDVLSYLENETQNIIISVLEEEFIRSGEIATEETWQFERAQWNQSRLEILNSMKAPSGGFSSFDKSSSLLMELPVRTSNVLGNQESIYAKVMADYTKSVQTGSNAMVVPRLSDGVPYLSPIGRNLISAFANAAEEFKNTKVNDMWEMLKYMTEVPPFPSHENVIRVRNTLLVQKALVFQAKRYLEDRYKTYMTSVINENLAEARRGGVPGTYSLARSYVGIRLQGEYRGLKGGMIDDRPLWPVVYYCLRSGDLSAAIHCLKQATCDVKDVIKLLEMKFKNPDNAEIAKLESNLQFEYKRVIYNSTDPFQRIIYDVLSCSDVADEHSEIAKTADDYLWLKLCFLRFDLGRDDSEGYRTLQSTILEEYGEEHYNGANQPHLYFQMLILTGQYEAGFEFLARHEKYQMHGVQMAIALNELQMLALPLYPSAALLTIDEADPKPSRRLNISRLIMIYVQRFELHAPLEAIQYYYVLRNITNEKNQKQFIKCVVDLATELCDYELLFGQIEPNGSRTLGCLYQFASPDVKIEDIAQATGKALIEKGCLEEAVGLFDYANNQEEVLDLMRMLLCQVVNLQTTEGSLRERLSIKTREIAERYGRDGYTCSAAAMSAFITLKDLLTFFDLYHAKKFIPALNALDEQKLIPLDVKDVEERVARFKRLTMEVSRVIPDVLLATMNILFAEYQKLKSNEYSPNRYQDASRDTQLVELRKKAKALTNFTGMLPYQLPNDFNSRLVQMEILMH